MEKIKCTTDSHKKGLEMHLEKKNRVRDGWWWSEEEVVVVVVVMGGGVVMDSEDISCH